MILSRFNFFGLASAPAQVTYTSTKTATASCPAPSTGPAVSRSATRTSTSSQADADQQAQQAAQAAANAALVCTTPTTPYTPPTFNTVLNPGESADVVTWSGAPGTQFLFNAPLPSGAPAPATMLVYLAGNQVGQTDFNGNVVGTACAVKVNGTIHYTTFQNGSVNLS